MIPSKPKRSRWFLSSVFGSWLPQLAEAVAQTLGHWIESQPTIWVTSCKAISRPLSPVRD